MADDALERGRDVLVRGSEISWVLVKGRAHRVRVRSPLERALAREHFIENGAEGENVRPAVRRLSPNLLRGHVAHGAPDPSQVRVVGGGGCLRGVLVAWSRQLRQSKIEDLEPPVPGHEKIPGLEITMDDAVIVSGREPMSDLDRDLHGLADG